MNSKIVLENALTLTKSLAMLYINGLIESSNNKVKKFMEEGLSIVLDMQEEIYKMMVEDGFYCVNNVKESEITNLYKKLIKDE